MWVNKTNNDFRKSLSIAHATKPHPFSSFNLHKSSCHHYQRRLNRRRISNNCNNYAIKKKKYINTFINLFIILLLTFNSFPHNFFVVVVCFLMIFTLSSECIKQNEKLKNKMVLIIFKDLILKITISLNLFRCVLFIAHIANLVLIFVFCFFLFLFCFC